jgi:hypothetical protein
MTAHRSGRENEPESVVGEDVIHLLEAGDCLLAYH